MATFRGGTASAEHSRVAGGRLGKCTLQACERSDERRNTKQWSGAQAYIVRTKDTTSGYFWQIEPIKAKWRPTELGRESAEDFAGPAKVLSCPRLFRYHPIGAKTGSRFAGLPVVA